MNLHWLGRWKTVWCSLAWCEIHYDCSVLSTCTWHGTMLMYAAVCTTVDMCYHYIDDHLGYRCVTSSSANALLLSIITVAYFGRSRTISHFGIVTDKWTGQGKPRDGERVLEPAGRLERHYQHYRRGLDRTETSLWWWLTGVVLCLTRLNSAVMTVCIGLVPVV